jgi:hypothetical protein
VENASNTLHIKTAIKLGQLSKVTIVVKTQYCSLDLPAKMSSSPTKASASKLSSSKFAINLQQSMDAVKLNDEPNDHHKWKVCPSNKDKVELYYMVLNGLATVNCIKPLLDENVSMMLPLNKGKVKGREEVLQAVQNFTETFAPYKISPCLLHCGPARPFVSALWHATGTHVKEIVGIAPTNRRIFLHGGTQFVFNKDGHIQHIHTHFDGNDLV